MIHARRLATLAAAAALLAAATPAQAEGTWLERLFSRGAPAPAPAPTPTRPAPPKPVPQAKPAEPAPVVQAAPPPATAAKAASPVAGAPAASPAAPTATAAIAPPAPAPALLSERAILDRANAYFNGLNTLVGDFTQIGGDGRKLAGKIYLQRPGKVRFEYAAPATLEVVADGSQVAVRDRKLATQDLYAIGLTPLKFLLSDRIDLAKDAQIVDAGTDADGVRLVMEDRSTLGGSSRISLFFDGKVENLTRWRIVDPQGFLTTVTLSNMERARRVDSKLFVINYDRALETGGNQ